MKKLSNYSHRFDLISRMREGGHSLREIALELSHVEARNVSIDSVATWSKNNGVSIERNAVIQARQASGRAGNGCVSLKYTKFDSGASALEFFRGFMRYEASTGTFFRTKDYFRAKIGDLIGTVPRKSGDPRYLFASIHGRRFFIQHLVWLFEHGEFPVGIIDHVNGNKVDNRIDNLRIVTHSQNLINRPVQKNNRIGVKGVLWRRNRYIATVWHLGKCFHVGSYLTLEEARNRRAEAALKIQGDYLWKEDRPGVVAGQRGASALSQTV